MKLRAAPLLLSVLVLAGCGGGGADEAATPPQAEPIPEASAAGVEELANVLQLRSDFESDAGKTRVILLLSPT
jgi:hypothetical protein